MPRQPDIGDRRRSIAAGRARRGGRRGDEGRPLPRPPPPPPPPAAPAVADRDQVLHSAFRDESGALRKIQLARTRRRGYARAAWLGDHRGGKWHRERCRLAQAWTPLRVRNSHPALIQRWRIREHLRAYARKVREGERR